LPKNNEAKFGVLGYLGETYVDYIGCCNLVYLKIIGALEKNEDGTNVKW